MDGDSVLEKLHLEYIKGIPHGGMVPDVTVLVVRIPESIVKACNLNTFKVYMTARALKHLHERRSKEDYKFITNNIWAALKHPTHVYKNLDEKRGDFLFVKKMVNDFIYACSIELREESLEGQPALFITTAFRSARGNYFQKLELLWERQTSLVLKKRKLDWSRKDGEPSS